jgi:phage shock protein A
VSLLERCLLRLLRDAIARITRAEEAVADGEHDLARQILAELELDLERWSA